MRIHIVMHESFEAPAAILTWAKINSHSVNFSKTYAGEKLPESAADFDYLIVMGGPQSPATTPAECSHYHADQEIELIKKAISADKLILGICLGAQLIGEALGAPFDHSPSREIGVYDLTLTEAAKSDPIFSKFPNTFPVGHWHGDMPGLTKESQILAVSEGCPRQIVRYSPKIYGFQCHFEFTQEAILGMIANNSEELNKYQGLPYIETESELKSHDFTDINSKLFAFLDYMAENYSHN